MTIIYVAADPVEAEIVRGLLAADHIGCDVMGAMLWGGRGEIAADPYPRIKLRDPRDETRAREILDDYRQGSDHPAWDCPCGENVPGSFAVCWCCGEPMPE